jgi:hypothetical protein
MKTRAYIDAIKANLFLLLSPVCTNVMMKESVTPRNKVYAKKSWICDVKMLQLGLYGKRAHPRTHPITVRYTVFFIVAAGSLKTYGTTNMTIVIAATAYTAYVHGLSAIYLDMVKLRSNLRNPDTQDDITTVNAVKVYISRARITGIL